MRGFFECFWWNLNVGFMDCGEECWELNWLYKVRLDFMNVLVCYLVYVFKIKFLNL